MALTLKDYYSASVVSSISVSIDDKESKCIIVFKFIRYTYMTCSEIRYVVYLVTYLDKSFYEFTNNLLITEFYRSCRVKEQMYCVTRTTSMSLYLIDIWNPCNKRVNVVFIL